MAASVDKTAALSEEPNICNVDPVESQRDIFGGKSSQFTAKPLPMMDDEPSVRLNRSNVEAQIA
jgi:hypothetical protein